MSDTDEEIVRCVTEKSTKEEWKIIAKKIKDRRDVHTDKQTNSHQKIRPSNSKPGWKSFTQNSTFKKKQTNDLLRYLTITKPTHINGGEKERVDNSCININNQFDSASDQGTSQQDRGYINGRTTDDQRIP